MTDKKYQGKPERSRLLAGFGAVTPKHKPEEWQKVRVEIEEAMAEEVVNEVTKPDAQE